MQYLNFIEKNHGKKENKKKPKVSSLPTAFVDNFLRILTGYSFFQKAFTSLTVFETKSNVEMYLHIRPTHTGGTLRVCISCGFLVRMPFFFVAKSSVNKLAMDSEKGNRGFARARGGSPPPPHLLLLMCGAKKPGYGWSKRFMGKKVD